mmetsp:Transcript_162468/g.296598  ORF Transcript_162468/g.296598 Transcript_162468/m.296598 type:complete len:848 (-) Transcript_162468:253-2796(-)
MAAQIPCFTETVALSAEAAAEVRMASRHAELSVEEDIWGKRGIVVPQDPGGLHLGIKPMVCDSSCLSMDPTLISCPRTAIQNLQDEEVLATMRQCFFRASITDPSMAEEVWLQDAVFPSDASTCRHVGMVITTNAHTKRPFCHIQLFPAAPGGNVECSTFRLYARAADMCLGRPCSLEYEEQADQRSGRMKLVATKVCFRQIEGVIMQRTLLGVLIRPMEQIRYGATLSLISEIFAAFDRCIAAPEAEEIVIGSRVFFDLHGPLSAPEACDWRVDGGTHFAWNLPLPAKFSTQPPCPDCMQNCRWFPWYPQELNLVIASDPKQTKFRDDAFECKLDADTGFGFLRVHIVNMASAIPKDSPQERWMRRILSRHHPADAVNTRTMFGDWANTSAGIGFTVLEHRPALTMQLNMKKLENGWAVNGPAEFFESMVQLSVLVDAERVTEEWVQKQDNVSTPEGLILHTIAGSEIEADVQQVFHDAQVVRESRWRRLDENGQLEENRQEDDESEGEDEDTDDVEAGDLVQVQHDLYYNSNTRNLCVSVEELQPSHYYASRLLKVMNSEAFRLLEGNKELFGLVDGSVLEKENISHRDERRKELKEILSGLNPSKRQVYEGAGTVKELEKFMWKDFGGPPAELYEALGWGAAGKKMALAADVPDTVCCKFEFTKPGRLYTQLVSQRLFLDFVRNKMSRPQCASYGMDELRDLMERANMRHHLNEKMAFQKDMALLEAAWPQIMLHGGLPTTAVVVEEGIVFVRWIQARVPCQSLSEVEPAVVVGTKVIIQLQKVADGYGAQLLTIRGRCQRSPETLEGPAGVTAGSDASEETDSVPSHPAVALRADAPAFVPLG